MRRISLLISILLALAVFPASGTTAKKKNVKTRKATATSTTNKKTVKKAKPVARKKAPVKKQVKATTNSSVSKTLSTPARSRKAPVRRNYQAWAEPTYADSTIGDRIEGEDLVVRRAAVEALGPYNGSVIVTDARTGRVLTIVNQKLALQTGFTPCSTIKLVTSIAGLVEGKITQDTTMRVTRNGRMSLTEALARSNNPYFSILGKDLGFEKVAYYSRMMGIGEKAGLDIPGEKAGYFPEQEPASSQGGLGLLSYCGTGIAMTPLQLSALVSMIANDGTMNWLQYPRTQAEVDSFQPKVKRQMDLQKVVEHLLPGMEGAVEWGSGQRARKNAESDEQIYGKTGTCTNVVDRKTHLGWFGAFNKVGDRRLSVVVLLTGGRPVNGPVASGIAGAVYRILNGQNYYANSSSTSLPLPELSTNLEYPPPPDSQDEQE